MESNGSIPPGVTSMGSLCLLLWPSDGYCFTLFLWVYNNNDDDDHNISDY